MHVRPRKRSIMVTFSDSDFEAACSFAVKTNHWKQLQVAETCLFPFLPGLESHYVSKMCLSPGISSFGVHSEKMLSQFY